MNAYRWIMVLLALATLVACAPRDRPPVTTPATSQPPPTPLISPTAGRDSTAAAAVTATLATARPSATAARPTTTPTPTATRDQSTAVPGATLPPPTPSPLPPVTNTPKPLPSATTAAAVLIDDFRANVTEADPGQTVTLQWVTHGAEIVTLWRIIPTGQFGQWWTVTDAGSFDYTISEYERNLSRFALSAFAAGETEMATLEIIIRCPDQWFFPNPPDICPAGPALITAGAEQHFQAGTMLWSAAEDRIYVLFGDGASPQWTAFTDEWDPGEPEDNPELQPPTGYYQPVRGFGQVWREQPSVRDRLGWAIDEEAAYQTAIQRTSYAKYNETYIRALDGRVWHLKAEHSGWDKR